MLFGGVIARVLDDAFADGEGEVETAELGIALFKPGDNAQGVEVVIEAQPVSAEALVEGAFAGMSEGWMADIVGQSKRLSECGVEAECLRGGACDLRNLKSVREPAARMVTWQLAGNTAEDLGFACQPAEGTRVKDAGAIACEGSSIGMGRLRIAALAERPDLGYG